MVGVTREKNREFKVIFISFLQWTIFADCSLSTRDDFGGLDAKILCGTVVLLGDIVDQYLMLYQAGQ